MAAAAGMFGRPKREEPPEAPVVAEPLSEQQERAAWRYLMLLDLGLTPDDSLHLIRNPHFDWHEAERLVKKGCPTNLVVRILDQGGT